MKHKVIMQCVATGEPYPVLNKDRQIECMIPVQPYSIVSVHQAKRMDTQNIQELLIRVTDSSRWLHFARTQKHDCFTVCGFMEENVIVSQALIKRPRWHRQ